MTKMKKKKILINDFRSENKNEISVYWYSIEQNFWKPLFRESCTLQLDKKNGFLFGGIGHTIFNDICVLNTDSFKWG